MHPASPNGLRSEALHVARSRFIDAYGAVEAAIQRRLRAKGIDLGRGQFGQKIEALRGIKASPQYSKAERKRVHEALDRLAPLNDIRCDLVHGQLHFVELHGEEMACFINPRNLDQPTLVARHVSLENFDGLIKELWELTDQLA